jgi:chloride channel 3/4/5
MQPVSPETPCAFISESTEQVQDDRLEIPGVEMGAWPVDGIEDEVSTPLVVRSTEREVDVIKLWPWVNQVGAGPHACLVVSDAIIAVLKTPLTVSPQLPLEIVMQLFKRMGYVRCLPYLRYRT